MVVMVFVSKIAALRSTSSADVLSKAGSHAALLVASAVAATPRLWRQDVQWVQVDSVLQEAASVVGSEVGLMVDAVASVAAAEAEVVSKTEDMAEAAEVVSDMEEAVDLVAVTEAEEDMVATAVMAHHLLTLQLAQVALDLVFRVHQQEVSALEAMVRARQIAMDLLLEAQVGMIADHHTMTAEAATVAMAAVIVIVEDIARHRAEAIWSQFVHASHVRTAADIATEIQETTTWAEVETQETAIMDVHHHHQERRRAESACTMMV